SSLVMLSGEAVGSFSGAVRPSFEAGARWLHPRTSAASVTDGRTCTGCQFIGTPSVPQNLPPDREHRTRSGNAFEAGLEAFGRVRPHIDAERAGLDDRLHIKADEPQILQRDAQIDGARLARFECD